MYQIIYKKSVAKDLRSIPKADLKRIINKIEKLTLEPRGQSSIKLHGNLELYRIRQGDYRIIYQIKDKVVTVVVVKVGHRKDIYERG